MYRYFKPGVQILITCIIALSIHDAFGENNALEVKKWEGPPNPVFKIIITPDNQKLDQAMAAGFNMMELQANYPGANIRQPADVTLGSEQYVHSKGFWVAGKKPFATVSDKMSKEMDCEEQDGTPYKGSKGLPCTASAVLRTNFAESCVKCFDYLKLDEMRLFDEMHSCACDKHSKELFPVFLEKKGYKPADFAKNWKSWSDLKVPYNNVVDANPTDGMKRLEHEYLLWKEENIFQMAKRVCDTTKAKHPQAVLNIGIMSPLHFYRGYDGCVPLHRFGDIDGASYIEIDFYEPGYTGARLPPKNICLIEACNQMATDISRLPLLSTKNCRFGDRTEGQFRIMHLASTLLNNNIVGLSYYFWNTPIVGEKVKFNPENPRLGWFSENIKRIKKAFPVVKEYTETSRILLVIEDFMYSGRGLDRKSMEAVEFNKKTPRSSKLLRLYQKVAQIHRDANFAIPRTVSRFSADDYDVILVNARHWSDEDFNALEKLCSGKNQRLLITPGALMLDETGRDKTAERAARLKAMSVQTIPEDPAQFRQLVESALKVKDFEPEALYENMDIDVRTNASGNKLFVLSNYNLEDRNLAFRVPGKWKLAGQVFENATVTVEPDNGETLVKASVPAQDMEIILLDKCCMVIE